MLKRLLLVNFLLAFTACQANSAEKSETLNIVESNLVDFLYSIYDDFQITEIFSKNDDKMAF
jgi:hypothetical protein